MKVLLRPGYAHELEKLLPNLCKFLLKEDYVNYTIKDDQVICNGKPIAKLIEHPLSESSEVKLLWIDSTLLRKALARSGFIIEKDLVVIFPYRKYYTMLYRAYSDLVIGVRNTEKEHPNFVAIPKSQIITVNSGVRKIPLGDGRYKYFTLYEVVTFKETYAHPLPKITMYLQYQIAKLILESDAPNELAILNELMSSFGSLGNLNLSE